MTSTLQEAFRYSRWANLMLLDSCAKLETSQLDLSAPGTYGSIAATLTHLARSEQWYLWLVTGRPGAWGRRRKFPGLAVLRERLAASGDALTSLASKIKPTDVVEFRERDWLERVPKTVIMVQALHHGNDHRTHVCTVLGSHGLHVPEMDVWAYGRASGRSVLARVKA